MSTALMLPSEAFIVIILYNDIVGGSRVDSVCVCVGVGVGGEGGGGEGSS